MDSHEIRARLAARLREAQELRGISTMELAERAGLARPHLHEVMAGRAGPSIDYVTRLATVLDVDPSTLLSGKAITKRTARTGKG